jgi:hypothetical protein
MAGNLDTAGSDEALDVPPVAGRGVGSEAGAMPRDGGSDLRDGVGDVEDGEGEREDARAVGDGGEGRFEGKADGAVIRSDAACREDVASEGSEGALEGVVEEETVEASPRVGGVGVVGELTS